MVIRTELLSITGSPGINFPPYSTRAARQTISLIPGVIQQQRTVNGDLKDLSDTNFRKYASVIQCTDMQAPDFSAWPGAEVTVDCIIELSYKTSGGVQQRTAVPGSSRVEGDYTFYRPRLTMLVGDYNIDEDEWGAAVGWTLNLEEK